MHGAPVEDHKREEAGVFRKETRTRQHTLLAFPRPAPFLPLGPAVSIAAALPFICDPPPRGRFLLSFVAEGGAKLPTGGIFASGLGVCTIAVCAELL